MAFRSFTLPDPRDDPPTFEVAGETFTCVPELPAGAWRALGGYTFSATSAHAFIEGVLEDEDVPRWQAVCASKERIVTNTVVADIVGWLQGEYANRPTGPLSPSADGRATSGPGSQGDADSPGSTSTPSASPTPST